MVTKSAQQERRAAKKYAGRRTIGSGNTPWQKNDVRTATESWELKTTSAKSYTLKAADLEQAEQYALLEGREMRFGIEMNGRNWVAMSEEDFDAMKAQIRVNVERIYQLQSEIESLKAEVYGWEDD